VLRFVQRTTSLFSTSGPEPSELIALVGLGTRRHRPENSFSQSGAQVGARSRTSSILNSLQESLDCTGAHPLEISQALLAADHVFLLSITASSKRTCAQIG
jgi:hypothetical protein